MCCGHLAFSKGFIGVVLKRFLYACNMVLVIVQNSSLVPGPDTQLRIIEFMLAELRIWCCRFVFAGFRQKVIGFGIMGLGEFLQKVQRIRCCGLEATGEREVRHETS